MMFAKNSVVNCLESDRLKNLMPPGWSPKIAIGFNSGGAKKSGFLKKAMPLIATHKLTDRSFLITIHVQRWQFLAEDVRNLLWWHELARIQQHSVGNGRQLLLLGSGVLGLTVLPLVIQDVVLLSIGLTIVGLAGFRYYQCQRGEQHLRSLTQADRGAIALAIQFGYSPALAYESLHSALKILISQVTMGRLAKTYRTRLEVLEIIWRENMLLSKQPSVPCSMSELS
jgi:Protein of unknown function (DUF3318)